MALFNFFRPSIDNLLLADREALLARYKHLRLVGRNLNNKLVQRLSKDVLFEGARKLGFLKGNTFVFDTEDESSVLMDYCIYDVRRDGQNAFESYLISCSPDSESDELTCLQAMQRAIYSLYVVETVERGLGVTMRDLRTDETHFVVDTGMGMSAKPELVFATRLLFHDRLVMTSGAGLPVGLLTTELQEDVAKKMLDTILPDKAGHYDPAPLIRDCLKNGSSSKIRYLETPGQFHKQQHLSTSTHQAEVGRYDPCPCGSGKKFKFCCLSRR